MPLNCHHAICGLYIFRQDREVIVQLNGTKPSKLQRRILCIFVVYNLQIHLFRAFFFFFLSKYKHVNVLKSYVSTVRRALHVGKELILGRVVGGSYRESSPHACTRTLGIYLEGEFCKMSLKW